MYGIGSERDSNTTKIETCIHIAVYCVHTWSERDSNTTKIETEVMGFVPCRR